MTIFIEDLICRLAGTDSFMFSPKIPTYPGDHLIINSFGVRIEQGIGLTEKQEVLAIRFCKKYQASLTEVFGSVVDTLLTTPRYRLTRSVSINNTPSVSIEDKKIIVKFAYNEEIIKNIRNFRSERHYLEIQWNQEKKHWELDLEEGNVLWIMNNFRPNTFKYSEEFSKVVEEISAIMEKIEDTVPMLVEENGQYRFTNISSQIPQPENMNVKQAFLLARRYGIDLWNETALKSLQNEEKSSILMNFLNKQDLEPLKIDATKISIDQFSDLIMYSYPVLIVVPGGNEQANIKQWTEWFKSQNIEENAISVMFRLDNSHHSSFNTFVKEHNLNAPLTKKTKVVFISQKIPKPIVASDINFRLVINLGSISGVHYSLSNYLDGCPDVIQYVKKEYN
jgi:hypothetical protein